MTTIITRLYQDEQTANDVASALLGAHFRKSMMDVISPSGDAHAEMVEAQVPKAVQEACAEGLQAGHCLLVVRAPFGAAEKAGIIVDQTESIDSDGANRNIYVRTDVSAHYRNSILTDHPRFMSSGMYPSLRRGRSMIAMLFGKPLLRKRVNLDSTLYRGTKYWANFPLPHLSRKPRNINNSIYRGTKFWANWPIKHLVTEKRDETLV